MDRKAAVSASLTPVAFIEKLYGEPVRAICYACGFVQWKNHPPRHGESCLWIEAQQILDAARTPSQPDLREAARAVYAGRIGFDNPTDPDILALGVALYPHRAALASQPAPVDGPKHNHGTVWPACPACGTTTRPAPADPEQPWREASRRLHEAGDDTDDGLVPTHARRPGDSLDDVEEASPDRLSGSNRSHPSQPAPSQPDLREALKGELRQAVSSALADGFNLTGPADAVVDRIWPYFDMDALASQPAPADPEPRA